jgi:hypothetical protein
MQQIITLTLVRGLFLFCSFHAVGGAKIDAEEEDVLLSYTSDQLFGAVRNDNVKQLRKYFETNNYRDIGQAFELHLTHSSEPTLTHSLTHSPHLTHLAHSLSHSDKPSWDGSGQSPLMAATLSGAPGIVQYLLDIGANPTIAEKVLIYFCYFLPYFLTSFFTFTSYTYILTHLLTQGWLHAYPRRSVPRPRGYS